MCCSFFKLEICTARLIAARARWLPIVIVLIGGQLNHASAEETIPYSRVATIFQKQCHGCHGPNKPKGDLRIDKLDPDLVNGHDGDRWREVLDRLNFGDMPPETEP